MNLLWQRLAQQRLCQSSFTAPEQVVARLGAVQSQEYPGGKWSLGLRLPGSREAWIDRAFDAGTILRTHVLRPTWHFVSPDDIRWMLELTAPRVHTRNATAYRANELDAATFRQSEPVLEKALRGNCCLTRGELGQALAQAGIRAEGLRLTLIVMHAELEGLLCSGPRRGKQFTYALLAERAPRARSLPREQALGELARRYFTGHGPATLKDFAWWSGLAMSDARAGLEQASVALDRAELDGREVWFEPSMPPALDPAPAVFLLPTYDELLVGYADFGRNRAGGAAAGVVRAADATLMGPAGVLGAWRRTLLKGAARVELHPFIPLSPDQQAAAQAAAQRYGEFLGLPVQWG